MDWVCAEIGRTCWMKPQSRFTTHLIGYILKNEIDLHKCWIIICVICAVRKARSMHNFLSDFFKKNFIAPLWIVFSFLKGSESLQGDSLLPTAKFPGDPPTDLIISRSMKGWDNLGPTWVFWAQIPGMGDQCLNH